MGDLLRVETVEQAKQNREYAQALTDLLFQLADDDFILAYRGSEWLGLAPHIEEDVAFSSMSQDMMGHAVMFYEMLEELGVGKADDLAQLREAKDFRNAILVERKNGTGEYNDNPHYDWAYAIVRSYVYGLHKLVRLEALQNSSYVPLTLVSRKMLTEHRYHLMHWHVWLKQLANSTDIARQKVEAAAQKVWADAGELSDLGPNAKNIARFGLIAGEELLRQKWVAKTKDVFKSAGLEWPGEPGRPEKRGRAGEHTADLTVALGTLSEVYRMDPAASW
ncbi:phenylacetate-CoA oxygenase subunit PaaC [Brevibacillus composti]|uniref:Phenylacetate-CoA oxygenase subunit PaaC n=1 Tax=Brevibacillus composti TaxID=2796470 RepID=A0A7T5EKS1_9BACL|nr:1,2-phenylacetyl-CoA epoxidase subunit PaaC [Brevibacillus composti]QQE74367.1 phenylacetate-CoA oxygenase subunit PaaC [Brevibacillus composti]QUO41449.1 phenylacetate-CoA oxygenase subunit PaaC [Brevibacillus composti]